MKTRTMILSSLLIAGAAACGDDGGSGAPPDGPKGPDAPPVGPCAGGEVRLAADISQNTTFEAECVYIIPRLKPLFVLPGATLTIEPGTVIKGEQGAILVITRGAKIMAEGTKEKPIVMTSSQQVGARTAGHWGGLLVLGAAKINLNTLSTPPSNEATYEAFTSSIPEGKFGGDNDNDNSGVIKYVRIEFAGFNFVADREFNNLTLAGVGSGTVIDYVQVHGGSDDGIEFFGGAVNAKHIVSSQNQDDGFDTDNGWRGKAQFIIVQNNSHPATLAEASNGYESDNHGTAASYTAEPRTEPTIYNATLVGDHDYMGVASHAFVFRRGTGGHYFNHIWFNFPKGPEFRDAATKANLDAVPAKLEVKDSVFFNNDVTGTNMPVPQATGDIVESDYLNAANRITFNDPGLTGALNRTTPNFKPANPITGATPPNDGFFDATATFVGAMGTDDWTAGWTAYPQN